jgi:pimeloyl-ACP methyl ester carboxylesterase/nitroreductase
VTLHAEETGPQGAPLVVLVHGSMDRSSAMAKLARRLETDLRVLRYDRRGYGRSVSVGPPFDMEAQVDDLVALLDGRPAVLIGHSFGGVVALTTAARHPLLVRAVGVYEAPLSWLATWPSHTAGGAAVAATEQGRDPGDVAEAFMRRMVGDRVWERLPDRTRQDRRAEGAALVGELADLQREPPFEADEIGCPVLVARGEHGAAHHVAGTALLAEWFDTDVALIDTAGHGAHASHPDEFADFARQVVASASDRPARSSSLADFEALARRRRTSLVMDAVAAVPDELVDRLAELATWGPNHKRTWPWRFAAFTGAGRALLGEAFAADQVAAGGFEDAKIAKTRTKYLRAPLVMLIGADDHPSSQLREENRDAVSAGIQNLLLGATAAGLASFWSSPPLGEAPSVLSLTGWSVGTQLVGVLYLGWPSGDVPAPERPPVEVTWFDASERGASGDGRS